jgi:hypothetical protein
MTEPKFEIKSWPQFFQPIVDGFKKHDMRDKTERDYCVGDVLRLREYDPFEGEYTGRYQDVEITFITSNDTPCAFSSACLDKKAAILSFELIGGVQTA